MSIKWRKGLKQGRHLSALLFNLCLELSLEAIERDENMQAAYVRTKEELLVKVTVQTNADDVVFVSESQRGIIQMCQILDQFVEWSRMHVNASKCAIASHREGGPEILAVPGYRRLL
jgi:hypothetical protein